MKKSAARPRAKNRKGKDGAPPHLATRLVRERAPDAAANAETLCLSSSFVFANAEEAAASFADDEGAPFIYSRFSNPTLSTFARRYAALEGGEHALAAASGMAAILACIMGVCQQGARIVASGQMFGATFQLLNNFIAKFGVRVDYVHSPEPSAWRAALQSPADLVMLESPSNPALDIYDIERIAAAARKAGALLLVDNCLCPSLQRPLERGADLVCCSATKYLDGQGRVVGGAIAGSRLLLQEKVYPFLRSGGPAMSPFNAWVAAKGMETLPLRMRAHSENALGAARWLQKQKKCARVLHTALPSHTRHRLAMRQQDGQGGGIVSVHLRGGRRAAFRFINALPLFSRTANFGDMKSAVTHPATTTHLRMTEEARRQAGITDNLVRLSLGLESQDDILAALACGLKAV